MIGSSFGNIEVMMFIQSAMLAFQAPAAAASTAMLVPKHFQPRAAGLNQSMNGVMTVTAALSNFRKFPLSAT